MDGEGFSGIDGRTSIFDYWGVRSLQAWANNGKFDGKNLNEATYYAGIRDTDTANADHLAAQPTDKASVSQNNRKPHMK